MGLAFDKCQTRPTHMETILTGLDRCVCLDSSDFGDRLANVGFFLLAINRYNPETTAVFQDYVVSQCEDRTFDCYANLALLKLWVYFFFHFYIYVLVSHFLVSTQRDFKFCFKEFQDDTFTIYHVSYYQSSLLTGYDGEFIISSI